MFSRTRSSKGAAASELDQRLELVEGGGDELCHTPSVAADLATGMDQVGPLVVLLALAAVACMGG